MCTTIKELLVAYKLFNKVITFQDLLNAEFDEEYLLTRFNLHGIEGTPIFFNSTTEFFLGYYNTAAYIYVFDDHFVLIKPNLYISPHIDIPKDT